MGFDDVKILKQERRKQSKLSTSGSLSLISSDGLSSMGSITRHNSSMSNFALNSNVRSDSSGSESTKQLTPMVDSRRPTLPSSLSVPAKTDRIGTGSSNNNNGNDEIKNTHTAPSSSAFYATAAPSAGRKPQLSVDVMKSYNNSTTVLSPLSMVSPITAATTTATATNAVTTAVTTAAVELNEDASADYFPPSPTNLYASNKQISIPPGHVSPPRSVSPPHLEVLDKKLTSTVKTKYRKARHEFSDAQRKINHTLEESAAILPAGTLLENGMFEYVKERIQHVTNGLIERMRKQFLLLTFEHWIWYSEEKHKAKVAWAGPFLVQAIKAYQFRKRYAVFKLARKEAIEKEAKLKAIRDANISKTATKLQSTVRMWLNYLKTKPLLYRWRKAIYIQRFYWRFQRLYVMRQAVYRMMKRQVAAFFVQRVFRGYLARKEVYRLRTLRRRKRFQAMMDDPQEAVRFYFVQVGASRVIQRWYKSYGWKHMLRRRRKKALLQEKQNKLILVIQKAARNFLKMLLVHKWRNTLIDYVALRERVIVVIQKLARRFLARMKWPEKYRRYFKIKQMQRRGRSQQRPRSRPDSMHRRVNFGSRQSQRSDFSVNDQIVNNECEDPEEEGGSRTNKASDALKGLKNLITGDIGDVDKKFMVSERARRKAFLFTNIKFGELEDFDRLNSAASSIQVTWRWMKGKRWRDKALYERALKMSKRLIRWYRYRVWLQDRDDAAWVIQQGWKAKLKRLEPLKRAAKVIQSIYRWRNQVYKKKMRLSRLHRFCRKMHNYSIFRNMIKFKRAVGEQLKSGGMLFNKSILTIQASEAWAGVMARVYVGDSKDEIHRFFVNISAQDMVDMNTTTKLLTEVGIVGKGKALKGNMISAQKAEMIFAVVKGPSQKKLSFKRFLEYIYVIACLFKLKIELTPAKPGNEDEIEEGDEIKQAGKIKGKDADGEIVVSEPFKYFKLRGRPAVIMYFFDNYLKKSAKFQPVRELCESEGGSGAEKRATLIVDSEVKKLQAFFMRQILRKRREKKMNLKAGEGFAIKQFLAVFKIQMLFRRYNARRKLQRQAQMIYIKYLDDNHQVYWKHTINKNKVYEKPLSLGKVDCGNPVQYPDEDESCVIDCSVCEKDDYAVLYCIECDAPYCKKCFTTTHKGGSRKDHVSVQLSMCIECDFQVATKMCEQCKDPFCDSCYKHIHRKGRLMIHTYNWICASCEVCHKFRARKTLTLPEDDGYSTSYCGGCFRKRCEEMNNQYGYDGIEYDYCAQFTTNVKYTGTHVDKYKEEKYGHQLLIEKTRQEMERRQRLKERKRNLAVTKIQSMVRSGLSRIRTEDFIEERKVFFELRAEEMKTRNSLMYKALGLFRLQPYLRSDTPKERLAKMYPSYILNVIDEACDGNFSIAYKLIREQEEFEFLRDAEASKRLHDMHEKHIADVNSSHARLMALKNKRLLSNQKPTVKEPRVRRRGKGYARFIRPKRIERGLAKKEAARKKAESDRQKALMAEEQKRLAKLKREAEGFHSEEDEEDEEESISARQRRKEEESKALAELAMGEEEVDLVDHSDVVRKVLKRAKLEINYKLASFRYHSLARRVKKMEYVLQHVKSQHAKLEEEREAREAELDDGNKDRKKKKKKKSQPQQIVDLNKQLKVEKITLAAKQTSLESAERTLKSVAGPRGLQRFVTGRRKNGLLLPFKVSARYGVPYLLVKWLDEDEEYIDPLTNVNINQDVKSHWREQGGWKYRCGTGDTLTVLGMNFKVVMPPRFKPPIPPSEPKTLEADSKGDDGDNAPNELTTEKVQKISEEKDQDATEADDEELSDAEESDMSEGTSIWSEHSYTEDDRKQRIYVDRPWILEDMQDLSVHKQIGKPFYMAPFYLIQHAVHKTLPAKKLLQISACVANRSAALMRGIGRLFDEDSETANKFRERSASIDYVADKLVKMNRERFKPHSIDFRIRRDTWRFLKSLYKGGKFMGRYFRDKIKELITGESGLAPYISWELSNNKTDIRVELDIEDMDLIEVGVFKMDTEASCEIMREYLHRRFSEKLEELKIGDSFLFKVQPEPTPEDDTPEAIELEKENEPITYSKDFISFKTDKETMEGMMVCTIVPMEGVLESGQFEPSPEYDEDDDLIVQHLSGQDDKELDLLEKEAEKEEKAKQGL